MLPAGALDLHQDGLHDDPRQTHHPPPDPYFELIEVHGPVSRPVQTVEDLLDVLDGKVVSDALEESDDLRETKTPVVISINAVKKLQQLLY